MHDDELIPPAGAEEERSPDASGPDATPARWSLPPELSDWQVWDVDGSVAASEPAAPAPTLAPAIADIQDDVLVVSLSERHLHVEAGGSATLGVTVLNNGSRRAMVRVHLEGWLDDRWVLDPYLQASINPGERRTLDLTITPPRTADSEAGDYHLAVVARSSDYPDRYARLGAILTVAAFDRLSFEVTAGHERTVTWWQRAATLQVTVANEGNHAIALQLSGSAPDDLCRFDFLSGGMAETAPILNLRPGQRARVPLRATVQRLPLIGLQSRPLPLLLSATAVGDEAPPRRLRTSLQVRPLIGPLQLASLTGLMAAGAIAVMLLVIVTALFVRAGTLPAAVAPTPAPAMAAPPVIIVNLNQPAAASPGVTGAEMGAPAPVASLPDPSLPLVLPDQITAPGNGGPARTVPATGFEAPAAAPAPARATVGEGGQLTYAQMFQEIGTQHDLDWRMLAAQAYVESSFDSLALSNAGAMGLMQVLPDTWREWAPAANASDPFDSYSNVQVAAVYLDYLRSRLSAQGHPEKEWMLVAYNWGPDRLNDFLAGGGAWTDLPDARRRYAEDILRIAQTIP